MNLEAVIVAAYNDFFKDHKELFRTDALEYWRQATIYKEQRLQRYKVEHGGYTADSMDVSFSKKPQVKYK